jgi:hypothetical protein
VLIAEGEKIKSERAIAAVGNSFKTYDVAEKDIHGELMAMEYSPLPTKGPAIVAAARQCVHLLGYC